MEDTKELLKKNALKLFADCGYSEVGVQKIVDVCEVTKPTLYHYFGSKEGLLQSILEHYYGILNQMIQDAAVYNGDLPLTLFKVVNAYFDFAKRYEDFYRLQLYLIFAPKQSIEYNILRPLMIRQYEIMEDLFVQAASNHGNMHGRHGRYSATFIGMINTYISLYYHGDLQTLDTDVIYTAVHQFQHGIYS